MSSNAKNRLGTRPGPGVDGARGGGGAQLLGLGLALEAKVCAGPGGGGQVASAPRCPGLVLETALHPSPPEPLWPSWWWGAPASRMLAPGPPGPCSPGPGIPAGHSGCDGQREGRASTASLEAPGLSGSVSRQPLWGPSCWAGASVRRGGCEEAQVPPAVPEGGTQTPSPLSPPRAQAGPHPGSTPPCGSCTPRLSSSPMSAQPASPLLRVTARACGSQGPRFQGILGGEATGAMQAARERGRQGCSPQPRPSPGQNRASPTSQVSVTPCVPRRPARCRLP